MTRIAVTGGIACGKSLVGSFLAEKGLVVCDADELAHKLMMPGEPVFQQVVKTFGKDILNAEGEIDRKVLGDRVFSDVSERLKLNAIVHPEVKKTWEKITAGSGSFVVNVPLLYEAGEGEGWDAVICVYASESFQTQRLIQRGLSAEGARIRIAAQMQIMEKMIKADYVIVNNGSVEILKEQTIKIWRNILENKYDRKTGGFTQNAETKS